MKANKTGIDRIIHATFNSMGGLRLAWKSEAAVDRVGPELHELSGRAKDIASAAVFFALVLMGVVWGLILIY
ncbi:diacylglycerol kinase [Pseudidiomarina sp.]|uniref:diacylglycerol kinase n=1 Tax=Pseudidiomarina sp. TaxID=2081707 RepID=UPI003A97F06D